MKKTVLTTLSAVLLAGLVGCSSGEAPDTNSNDINESNQNKTEQVTEGNKTNGNETNSNETNSNETENYTVVYGKVKKVIGNEIDLSLTKDPYANMEEGDEEDSDAAQEFPATMADSIKLAPGVDPGSLEGLEGLIKAPEGMDLEYTGEEESYTLPTGVSVMNYKTYSEGSVNDIKEGSVVCLTISGTGDTQKIIGIDILE